MRSGEAQERGISSSTGRFIMKKLALVLTMSMLSGCNPSMDEYSPRDFSFARMGAAMDAPDTVQAKTPRPTETCRPKAQDRFD
jgi:hypothetical protein